jgi:hypothetical protein
MERRPTASAFASGRKALAYDRNLFSPAVAAASLDYIHNDPVKRRLCQRAIDWKWSSARWHLGEPPRRRKSALPRIAGIPSWLFAGLGIAIEGRSRMASKFAPPHWRCHPADSGLAAR